MKGMLDFLEKAGLVKRDEPVEAAPAPAAMPAAPAGDDLAAAAARVGDATPVDFEALYAQAGIAASVFPAERLLRLIDGLSAMDGATRLLAIKAMDAADDAWRIEDPLTDAAAKVQALSAHAERLRAEVKVLERDTQARLQLIAAERDKVVGEIRRQIAELEALAERETARAAEESAAHEADLQAAREQTARRLDAVSIASRQLQSLSNHFGAPGGGHKD